MSGIISSVSIIGGLQRKGTLEAESASKKAAATEAGAQTAQLEYLKEREAIPQAYREQAISQLGALYGLEGTAPVDGVPPALGRAEFVQGLQQDPFYEQLRASGEEAVLRGASATGGLRSGAASEALAGQNQALLRGLYQERVGGLQGLAGLPSGAQQIGQVIGDIGATRAAGQTALGQIQQQGYQGFADIASRGAGMII